MRHFLFSSSAYSFINLNNLGILFFSFFTTSISFLSSSNLDNSGGVHIISKISIRSSSLKDSNSCFILAVVCFASAFEFLVKTTAKSYPLSKANAIAPINDFVLPL